MKFAMLIIVLVLAGCASRPSLEELEQEALVTGDWTAVESREQLLERRRDRVGYSCPDEMTRVCIDDGAGDECYCVQPTGYY